MSSNLGSRARPILAAGLLSCATLAGAATITVTTLADELNTNGNCSLREAVQAANTNAAVDACAAGAAGADVIVLPAGTIPVAATIQVNESVTIRGAGRASTTIQRGAADAFNSSAGGVDIALEDLALQGAMNASGGGLATNRVNVLANGGTINTLSGPIALTDTNLATGNSVNSSSGNVTLLRTAIASDGTVVNTLSGNISLTDTSITAGGQINTSNGTVSLVRSSIVGPNGDGINASSGNITLVDSQVTGAAGSGIDTNSGTVSLTRSLVSGSHDTGVWGGSGVTAVNSTISGSGEEGVFSNGTINLDASTVTLNAGNGIRSSGGTLVLVNTIVAGNTPANCSGVGVTTSQYSIDSGASCNLAGPGDRPNTNPLLGPLANNTGPMFTHMPQPGSPAIDNGSNVACQAVDQRGVARPIDGDGVGGAACDIGAVEAGAGGPPVPAATPVPTLSQWALVALGLLVAFFGVGNLERARRS